MSCSYLEIYNEQVLDLLRVNPSQRKRDILPARMRVREHPKDGPYVQGNIVHQDQPILVPSNISYKSFKT